MPLHPAYAAIAKDDPDARAQRSRGEKQSVLLGWMEKVFCVNCGKPHGMISKEWAQYVFCLCDDCVFTHGKPPGVDQVPDALVHRRMERLQAISIYNDAARPVVAKVFRRGTAEPLLILPIAAHGSHDWGPDAVVDADLLFARREDLVVEADTTALRIYPGWDES